jgi:hypothetical protein
MPVSCQFEFISRRNSQKMEALVKFHFSTRLLGKLYLIAKSKTGRRGILRAFACAMLLVSSSCFIGFSSDDRSHHPYENYRRYDDGGEYYQYDRDRREEHERHEQQEKNGHRSQNEKQGGDTQISGEQQEQDNQ